MIFLCSARRPAFSFDGTRSPSKLRSRGGRAAVSVRGVSASSAIGRAGAALSLIATASVLGAVLFVVLALPVKAEESAQRCDGRESIRVLFLLDTSRSLRVNDPDGRRETGTVDALDDLGQIVEDYRLRLRRHYPHWSVFAAVDTFSGLHDEPELNNPYNRLSGSWQDLGDLGGLQALRQAAGRALEQPGYWTDYREAIRGVLDRFAEPLPNGIPSCDYLFWFTDGDHDTISAGVSTPAEQAQIDDMCRVGGLVDQLRRTGVNVTAIELRVQRDSSAQLRRLVVGGPDCVGLDGEVADVASVADLATGIEETVFRLVDPDFPREFLDPCESNPAECEYRFTLSDGVEWVKVYVDLRGVRDRSDVSIALHGPDGTPIAPFAFGDDWTRISTSGMLGRQPTRNISVAWAHRVARQVYGMEWGDDQVWTLVFSGAEAANARAGIRKDERGAPTLEELQFSGSDLRGRINPAPSEDEMARLVLHLDDGRNVEVSGLDGRIRSGGRFTIPGIVDRVARAARGDDYLPTRGCVGTAELSVNKVVDYGSFSGPWTAPLRASVVEVPVPRALCGLSGRMVPTLRAIAADPADRFDPAGTLAITADGGFLDGLLTVTDVHIESVSGSSSVDFSPEWSSGWRCDVPADAVDYSCGDAFRLTVNADSDSEVDIRLSLSSISADPMQEPPVVERTTYIIRDVLVDGKLPGPVIAAVDESRPGGFLDVSADGGTADGVLVLDGLIAESVNGSAEAAPPILSVGDWRCVIPAGARAQTCPPLQVLSGLAAGDVAVDVVLSIRGLVDDPNHPQVAQDMRVVVRDIIVPSALPAVSDVVVEDRFDPSGSLRVITQGGVFAGSVTVETASDGLLPVESVDGVTPRLRPGAEWRCEVPAGAVDHVCPTMVIEATAEGDATMDLIVPLRAAGGDPATVPGLTSYVRVEDISIGVRETGEVLEHFMRYLLIAVAVFLAVRVLSAGVRRRWTKLSNNMYFVADGRVEGDVIVPGALQDHRCRELRRSVAKAELSKADVALRVPWWPLLAGWPLRIVATAKGRGRSIAASGQVDTDVTRFAIRSEPDSRTVGQALNGGWVIVERDHNHYQLVLWDGPRDEKELLATVERIWREFERRPRNREPSDPSRQSLAQSEPQAPPTGALRDSPNGCPDEQDEQDEQGPPASPGLSRRRQRPPKEPEARTGRA